MGSFVLIFRMLSFYFSLLFTCQSEGRRSRDRMVVGFIPTCAISAYHH